MWGHRKRLHPNSEDLYRFQLSCRQKKQTWALLNLSESQFPHLESVDNNFYSTGLLGRFDNVMLWKVPSK